MPSKQPITAVLARQPGRQAIEITRKLDAIALDARAVGRPVAWQGHEVDAALDRIGLGAIRIATDGEFSKLVAGVTKTEGRVPVWTGANDPWHALRLELAMQQSGHGWWIVERPRYQDAHHARVSDDVLSWETATDEIARVLPTIQRSEAACVAALVEAEPDAVERVARALGQGRSIDELRGELAHAGALSEVVPPTPSEPHSHAEPAPGLSPGYDRLIRQHASALRSKHSAAWLRAANGARAAGHADIAQYFSTRAFSRAIGERARLKARISWAASCHEGGRYTEAHEHFHETIELLTKASPADPLLATLLTEQSAALAREGRHAEAAAEAAHALAIWKLCARGPLVAMQLEALRLHGRSLAEQGEIERLTAWLTEHEAGWPGGSEGQLYLTLEQARVGVQGARERLVSMLRRSAPCPKTITVGLDLAVLELERPGPRAAVAICLQVLRLLRFHYGTDVHPQGVAARMLVSRALADHHPTWAMTCLQRALADCETIHKDAAHQQTMEVVLQLAELMRRRGDLTASMALNERAERIRSALGSLVRVQPLVLHAERTQGIASIAASTPTKLLLEDLTGSPYEHSDANLLERIKRGDFHAREILAARNYPRIQRYFIRKVGADAADDLAQQTFASFFSSLDQFRGRSSISSYLFAIARRVLLEHFRRSHHQTSRPVTEPAPATPPDPEETLAELADRHALARALRRIPLEHQWILFLYYFESAPLAVITEILALPESSVRSRLRRAKQSLQEALAVDITASDLEPQSMLDDPLVAWVADLRSMRE